MKGSHSGGRPAVQLHNVALESKLARSQPTMRSPTRAQRPPSCTMPISVRATRDRDRLARQTEELASEVAKLDLRSPISGVVLTPRVSDRLGTYVVEGTELVEVADLNTLRARIYLSEHDMYKLRSGFLRAIPD